MSIISPTLSSLSLREGGKMRDLHLLVRMKLIHYHTCVRWTIKDVRHKPRLALLLNALESEVALLLNALESEVEVQTSGQFA